MITDRVWPRASPAGRRSNRGKRTRRTLGLASLGGAALDNEENYLMKKLYTAMGAVQIENQARV
jgi:formate dehydrogenase major subunit